MKRGFILGASITLLASGLVVSHISQAIAEEAESQIIIDDTTFQESYEYNQIIDMPTIGKTYFSTPNGLVKATYGEVVFPDRNARKPGRHTLNIPGKYKVSYYDDNNHSYVKEFVVRKNIYEDGSGVTSSYYNALPVSGLPGIEVTLVSGSSFKFNKTVNIHSFKNGMVDVIDFYPIFRENKDDIPAASFCTVKLVDAYDSSKFLEIYTWCDKSSAPYYAGAGAAFQNFTGLEYNPNRPDKINCVFEGVSYNKHVTTRYQVVDAYGVWGSMNDNTTLKRDKGCAFTWNLNNNQVWWSGTNSKLITDLDAVEVYDSNPLNIDEYFTTGEVYAQFECFGFNSTSMKVEIPSILGMSGTKLKDGIVEDTTGPSIVTKFLKDKNSVTIFKDQKFYIPTDVQVNDFNYYGDLKSTIYYNYGQPDQFIVNSSDYFIPTLLGNYSLVYSAKDSFGNETKKVVALNCVANNPFEFNEDKVTSLEAATTNAIPALNVKGKNGEVNVKAYAVDPKGKRVSLNLNESKDSYDLTPLYIGEYEIVYEINDAFYSTSYTYKVNSVDTGKVFFDKKPMVYPSYIKGASYSIEPLVGLKATENGPVEVETNPYIAFDSDNFTKISDPNKFTITGSSTVKFKFMTGNIEYRTDTIEIVDVNFGKRSVEKRYAPYFQGDYVNSSEESSSLKYEFDKAGEMSFINFISFANYAFNYSFTETTGANIEVRLSNYQDSNNYVSATVERVTSSTYQATISQVNENGVTKSVGFFNSTEKTNDISIVMQGTRLYINDYVSLDLSRDFELSVLSVITKSACTIDVEKINNQGMLKATKMIENGPQVYYERRTGSFDIDSEFKVSSCVASCVLSPVLFEDVKISVFDNEGNNVKSVDDVLLNLASANREYTIYLSECGQYKVNYIISAEGSTRSGADKITNDKVYYIVNVDDVIDPVVTFDDHSTLEIKVGQVVKVRSYTVSDNHTAKDKLKVVVMVMDDHFNIMESGYNVATYAFQKVGTFKVVAYVFDEYGNYSSDSYTVIVRA